MKTTLDMDRHLLEEAVRTLGAASEREAIEMALAEAVRTRRRRELVAALGTFELAVTLGELACDREDA